MTLLEQLSRYTRINYALVISDVLAYFKVTKYYGPYIGSSSTTKKRYKRTSSGSTGGAGTS